MDGKDEKEVAPQKAASKRKSVTAHPKRARFFKADGQGVYWEVRKLSDLEELQAGTHSRYVLSTAPLGCQTESESPCDGLDLLSLGSPLALDHKQDSKVSV